MTAVYLSNNRIQALGGDGGGTEAVVTRCAASADIAACMFNGSVSDRDGFCRVVKQLFDENGLSKHSVALVLNTTQIITRVVKAPAKDEAGTVDFIANEFRDIERTQEPVYGYSTLAVNGKTKINRLLALTTEEKYIADFVELFKKCGITLSSVQPAVCCAVRALHYTAAAGKTCIIQVMEDTGFASILLINGVYAYSTYTRLASAHGTPEFGSEMARSVSMIIQFAKAQQVDSDISDVYFAGFSPEDRAAAAEAIGRMSGLIGTEELGESKRIRFKCGVRLCDCLFAAGGMLMAERTVNLMRRLSRAGAKKKKLGRAARTVLLLVLLAAALAAASAALLSQKNSKQAQLDAINSYNNSDAVAKQMEEYNALNTALGEVNAKSDALQKARDTLAGYPLPNSGIAAELQACASGLATVEIVSYDSATGQLQFNTQAAEVDNIHTFIDKLAGVDTFEVLDYSGYEYIESAGVWSVYVTVVLAPDAGRGN